MSDEIRFLDVNPAQSDGHGNALDEIYADALDAVVLRRAFPAEAVTKVGATLAAENLEANWDRPNRPVPGIDIRLLGTGAAPTATAPGGPQRDAYFDSVVQTTNAIRDLFGPDFDPFARIEAGLARLAAGRPV